MRGDIDPHAAPPTPLTYGVRCAALSLQLQLTPVTADHLKPSSDLKRARTRTAHESGRVCFVTS
eukprot:scaffold53147_cov58-Phaeocystis_antarctica.AAC.1